MIASTVLCAKAVKLGSNEPSGFSRATNGALFVPTFVNTPPTRILPSGWSVIASTVLSRFGLNVVSTEPSLLRRAM